MEQNLIDPENIIPLPMPGELWPELGDSIAFITEDIDLQVLYSAYMQGIFPWFSEEDNEPVIWHSPNPRFCIQPEDFHLPKRLERFLKHTPYSYTMDKCFDKVITECSLMNRKDQDGTWIGSKIIDSYTKLFQLGYAHSVEAWKDDELAGGFYGVLIGSVFFGESMFTKQNDSSKSAFAVFMKAFLACGGLLVDSQCYTNNIARYGARNISRDAFLRIEKKALRTPLEKDLEIEFEKQSMNLVNLNS